MTSPIFSANSTTSELTVTWSQTPNQSFLVKTTTTATVQLRPKGTFLMRPLSHRRRFPWASNTLPWGRLRALTIYPMRCSNWRARHANPSSSFSSTRSTPRPPSHLLGSQHISPRCTRKGLSRIPPITDQSRSPAVSASCLLASSILG